jgi:Uma2 family endonuclease
MSVAQAPVRDEHDFYPVHEEDNVPIRPDHEIQVTDLLVALRGRFQEYWVIGDVCMYWERGNYQRYRAPDVLVAQGPRHEHDVFLTWSDGAGLLAIEVGSKSTFRADEGPKVEDYLQKLGVREYLYFWPHQDPRKRRVKFWRLVAGAPAEIEPNSEGRWESLTLQITFGVNDEGRLRAYELDGRLIPGPNELQEQVATERRRATLETLRAESEHERAEQERQRANELEQELARLREQLRAVRGEDS